jgi:iron complex transport system ATP-binding protein
MSGAAPVLVARGVGHRIDGNTILDGVDVEARAGEVLALVGPNGAGKSTLLGVLSGDHDPDRGAVTVDGRPLDAWSSDELAVRRGVLLQQVDVSFPFTVTQVVRMGRAPWAGTAAEDWDDDVIAEAMSECDVAHFAGRVYTSLSGGERARAALARVLAQEPSILLLDEPTAALDIRHQELMLGLVRDRARRGDAVVVVMHDLALAAAYADSIVVMAAGEIRAHGAPARVLTESLLSDVYEHPIEVLRHPGSGAIVILPRRDRPVPVDDDSFTHANPPWSYP